MLYDPKWETKTSPLASFAAWVALKNPDEYYAYEVPTECAWAQFSGQTLSSHQLEAIDVRLHEALIESNTFGELHAALSKFTR